MRGGGASDGLRDAFMSDDPSQFRQARSAIGSGAERLSDFGDVRSPGREATASRMAFSPTPKHAQTTCSRSPKSAASPRICSSRRSALSGPSPGNKASNMSPGNERVGRSDAQAAVALAIDDRRGAIDAARCVEMLGEPRIVREQPVGEIVPQQRAVIGRQPVFRCRRPPRRASTTCPAATRPRAASATNPRCA